MGAQDGQWFPEPVKCWFKLEARGEVEGRRLLQAKGLQALGLEGLGFGPSSIPFFCWSWAGFPHLCHGDDNQPASQGCCEAQWAGTWEGLGMRFSCTESSLPLLHLV